MRKYIADSWDSIDQYQLINDKESNADEHVRLRNLITQQKARIYSRIEKVVDKKMLKYF